MFVEDLGGSEPPEAFAWLVVDFGDGGLELYFAEVAEVGAFGKRPPVLVIQSEPYNDSRLATVLTAVITSNTGLAAMPGRVFLPASASGLPRDSVVNVTALVTLNKSDLTDWAGQAPTSLMREVDQGLRRGLGL